MQPQPPNPMQQNPGQATPPMMRPGQQMPPRPMMANPRPFQPPAGQPMGQPGGQPGPFRPNTNPNLQPMGSNPSLAPIANTNMPPNIQSSAAPPNVNTMNQQFANMGLEESKMSPKARRQYGVTNGVGAGTMSNPGSTGNLYQPSSQPQSQGSTPMGSQTQLYPGQHMNRPPGTTMALQSQMGAPHPGTPSQARPPFPASQQPPFPVGQQPLQMRPSSSPQMSRAGQFGQPSQFSQQQPPTQMQMKQQPMQMQPPQQFGRPGQPLPPPQFNQPPPQQQQGQPLAPPTFGQPLQPPQFGNPSLQQQQGQPLPPPSFGQPPQPHQFGQQPGPQMQPPQFGQAPQQMQPPQFGQAPQQMQPPQFGQAPQQQPGPAAPRSRIDPNQIPFPIAVHEADAATYTNQIFSTASKSMPPLASTDFIAHDEGNANPRFVRLTTYSIPCTDELLQTSQLPLGLVITPLAQLKPSEPPIPLIDHGASGPVRCQRCKAYLNPFVTWTRGGKGFVCNLCNLENDCPDEYYCPLDVTGRRADIEQRGELKCGTVEYVVGKDYCQRTPSPMSVIFCIDVSYNSVRSGLILAACDAAKKVISNGLPAGARVGIMTYDKFVQFYAADEELEEPKMMVISEIDDVFVPVGKGFLCDIAKGSSNLMKLLTSIPKMYKETTTAECIMGAALKGAYEALKPTGGKLLMFGSTLPQHGPGALKNREDVKLLGTDKEMSLYEPADGYWRRMGEDCVNAGVQVDTFLAGSSYMDVASIGSVSALTSGETYLYPGFSVEKDGVKVVEDTVKLCKREWGYDALMRVRCSNGLHIKEYLGNFFQRTASDVELAGLDSETSIGILVNHESKLDERSESSFQVALLYTTAEGLRRVRVHTISVPNTTLLGNVFRHAEMDTTVNLLAKNAITDSLTITLKNVRDNMTERCVKILAAYRRHCASSTSPGQLILPESFKLFPLYSLSLHKTPSFRSSVLPTDIRVASMRHIRGMAVKETVSLLYPRLFPVHDMDEGVGKAVEDVNGVGMGRCRIKLPRCLRLSFDRMDESGVYLIENGLVMMLWIGKQAPPTLLKNLFGADTLDKIDPKQRFVPVLDTQHSQQLRAVISYIQSQRAQFLSLHIVRQGLDPHAEAEFSNLLVEDKNLDAMSYVDYLCHVHRLIQVEISQGN